VAVSNLHVTSQVAVWLSRDLLPVGGGSNGWRVAGDGYTAHL